MRGFLASSIGVATAAALALPLALPTPSQAAAAPAVPAGSTRSLPLVPVGTATARAAPVPGMPAVPPAPEEQGLSAREVDTFSMVGVVWDNAAAELHGRVQVRSRSARTAAWSGWQDVETHNVEHAADPDAAERASGRVRGSTAPLWVGESDGIEVRVRAEPGTGDRAAGPTTVHHLPSGLRIELVDPGGRDEWAGKDAKDGKDRRDKKNKKKGTGSKTGSGGGNGRDWKADGDGDGDEDGDDKGTIPLLPGMSMAAAESSHANVPLAALGATEITAQNKADSTADAMVAVDSRLSPGARPYIGPRPRIVTRRGWGADESLREAGFVYTDSVKAAFVHHTASGNNYECAEAPAVLRSLYRYHVVSSGWRDFGYNFAVDKCGTVYEGRAGGVAKPVLGAHTMGFNGNSMGVAVLGTYTDTSPPAAAVDAVARLTAWKLGLYGANPLAKTTLKSGGGNLYTKGSNVSLNVISGHRDGFATECPGRKLYGKLGSTRSTSARFQGR